MHEGNDLKSPAITSFRQFWEGLLVLHHSERGTFDRVDAPKEEVTHGRLFIFFFLSGGRLFPTTRPTRHLPVNHLAFKEA